MVFLNAHNSMLNSLGLPSFKMIRYLFWVYILAIIFLVTLPINSVGELNDITILHFRGDYFFHTLMFIPWAYFVNNFRTPQWLWLTSGLLLATGSELIQCYLPYRAFNINDLLANSIGVILGYIGFYIYRKVKVLYF